MMNRPTDREKVDRYVGQIERIKKQLDRLAESMTMSLDTVSDPDEEMRLNRMLGRVVAATEILDLGRISESAPR